MPRFSAGWLQVQHITTPSRTLLEVIKDEWIAEAGGSCSGNDTAAAQALWEAPLDVKPLLTEQDKADLSAARDKGREDGAIKKIARRFKAEKVAALEARGVKENLRFDPKLKGQVSPSRFSVAHCCSSICLGVPANIQCAAAT